MSDAIEHELHGAFEAKIGVVSSDVINRLSRFDYHPRERRRWSTARLGLAVSTTTLAIVAVVVAVISLSSGATSALAGWTAVPARMAGSSLTQARKVCGDVPNSKLLASEGRGPFVAIVFVRGDDPWQCITRGTQVILKQTTQYPARVYSSTPAGKISTPSLVRQTYATATAKLAQLNAAEQRIINTPGLRSQHLQQFSNEMSKLDHQIFVLETGPQSLTGVTGTAGAGVKAVEFVLKDHQTVSAIVQDGWYEAWWPGSANQGAVTPVTVRVTTASGTRSAKVAYGPVIELGGGKLCSAGASCSVFAPTVLKQSVAPLLLAHYAFFKNTPPTPASAEPKFVRTYLGRRGLSFGNAYQASEGIDNAQTRGVKLPGGHVLLVIPGTEGLCTTLLDKNNGGGGCPDTQTAMRWGAFGVSGSTGPNGESNTLSGLVPNGNRTVTINLTNGKKLVVPVHDNVVYATFDTAARSVTFKNAFGNVKHYPA